MPSNQFLRYRPLIGGVSIVGLANEIGTLGLVMTSNPADPNDRWILSNYHVLVGQPGPAHFGGGEPVFQPAPPSAVARLVVGKADPAPDLDCAAALVNPGVAPGATCVGGILGIGAVMGVLQQPPNAGLRVIKCGATTGITEGVVQIVNGNLVTIGRPPECLDPYILGDRGDSGAVWVTREPVNGGRLAVALHLRSAPDGSSAFGILMSAVSQRLGLQPLV